MTEQKRRGRPPGSGKKKVIKSLQELGEVMNEAMKDFVGPKPVYDAEKMNDTTIDEPAKYQTAPMSNWAIENRKKKLGLKD